MPCVAIAWAWFTRTRRGATLDAGFVRDAATAALLTLVYILCELGRSGTVVSLCARENSLKLM